MSDDELLKQIQRAKLLDEPAVTKLRRESLLSGRSAEAIIFGRRLIDEEKLARLKSVTLNVPYKKIDAAAISSDILDMIPEETARTYGSIPISRRDNLLVVGMLNPDDTKAQDALKFVARQSHLNLGVYVISYGDWESVLRKYSPYRSEVERAVQSLGLKHGEGGRKIVSLDEGGSRDEAPIIRIVGDTFKEAISSKASDIHIEPQESYLRIRFRVDGDLREVASLPLELSQPVISRIKVISSLKIDENRIPQDGRFRSRVFDREIDFRVSTFPTPLGEKVAIRVLDSTVGLKDFSDLGLIHTNLDIVKEGINKPFGMILVTGPTGSGKTTTIYALLQILNKENVNIVSLEDPVEYFVSGVNQSQVRPEIGYDFSSGLRQILRQDPDIIMVGEIRDNETAGLGVQAALTGHIVLSTLHTNNALGVIPRLLDMKIEPFLLPVSLNLMIGQRLVGLLCQDCKEAEAASPAIEKAINKALSDLPPELQSKYKEPHKIYHGKGCPKCRGRGTVGRGALFEVLKMSPELEEVISSGPTQQRIFKVAKDQGMMTMRTDGVLKALDGLVTIEEVIRETEDM
ncbi:MAG: type II/IV secretion system protein [Patescibacteria group bacterium]|nr:GspE/PulE family protein [Patescibacteria group bacterium]MDE2015031.1 type II/IV secretion system protein [Patescibacteria group bacterium]MDE2226459.1 type II/IV secretion system protein [Patescibacteria group bacterium]